MVVVWMCKSSFAEHALCLIAVLLAMENGVRVKNPKASGAHVKFINCTRLSSFDVANLKKIGGDNVKFA